MDNPADNTAKPAPGDNASLPEEKKTEEVKIELPKESSSPPPPIPQTPPKPELVTPPASPPKPPEPPQPPPNAGPTLGSDKVVAAAPPKRSPMKSILIALVLLLTAASVGLGYYYFQKAGLPFDIGKKAEVAPGCEGCKKHSGGFNCGFSNDVFCSTDGTCKKESLCDWSCCFTQELQPTSPPSDPCAGKSGSICQGVGDGDGSTSVLNCSGSTQTYTCQSNHTRFNDESSCKSASKTDEWTGYSTLVVEHGKTGTCSVGAGGNCDIGQADILPGGTLPEICWDVIKDCSNCAGPTNTPTPKPTSTPTPIVTSTPSPTPPVTACECTRIEISGASGVDEESQPIWQVGDQLQISVYFSGSPDDVAVRILKDGLKVADKIHSVISGGAVGASPWSTTYTIAEPGDYEIVAFVKKDGVWK